MRLLNEQKKETCFDGSEIYEYYYDNVIEESVMYYLAENGDLSFYPDFAKPFFKIITNDDLQIKGVLGDKSFEVVYPKSALSFIKEKFLNKISSF